MQLLKIETTAHGCVGMAHKNQLQGKCTKQGIERKQMEKNKRLEL
jgi:hypothetical protein